MTEIIIGELRIFPRLTNIDRDPAAIGKEFRPAMVAVDRALVFVRGDCCANCESSWNSNTARQRNKVGVEVGAITRSGIAGKHRVTAAPALARFVVAHPSEHVIVKRLGALEIAGFSRDRLLGKSLEGFVYR